MMIFHSIVFNMKTFIDEFAEQIKTHNLFTVTFFGLVHEIRKYLTLFVTG